MRLINPTQSFYSLISSLKASSRSINRLVDGILLAVVTVNTFIVFLPYSLATSLSAFILCKLLYQYLPSFTKKLYTTIDGEIFTEKRWVRLLLICLAILGYFITALPKALQPFLINIEIIAMFIVSFPLAYFWSKENRDVHPIYYPFWKVTAEATGHNLLKESRARNDKLFFLGWCYVPGLVLSAMGLLFWCVFLIIFYYSQLFTLLLVGWLLSVLPFKFKQKGPKIESPKIEKKLLMLVSSWSGSFKSIFGSACVIVGFMCSGFFTSIFTSTFFTYSHHLTSLSPFNLFYGLYLFSNLFPITFQFCFWYAVLRRFPLFLQSQRGNLEPRIILSLPTGHIYAFVGSCIAPLYTFIVPIPLFQKLLQSIPRSYVLPLPNWVILGLVKNFVFAILLLHTLVGWRKNEHEYVTRDNINVPLAISVQSIAIWWTGYFLKVTISYIFPLICMLLVALFFWDDLTVVLRNRYGESMKKSIINATFGSIILVTVNLISSFLSQTLSHLTLVISIILVAYIIGDVVLEKQKK